MWQQKKEWSTEENKGKDWQNHDASVAAAAVGKKAHLQTKEC